MQVMGSCCLFILHIQALEPALVNVKIQYFNPDTDRRNVGPSFKVIWHKLQPQHTIFLHDDQDGS